MNKKTKEFEPPKRRKTTHKRYNFPERVKIHYFLHPLYQQEVKVIDTRNFVYEKFYLIELFDKTTFLPAWMTDPAYCSTLALSEKPQCSLESLHALSLLIEKFQF